MANSGKTVAESGLHCNHQISVTAKVTPSDFQDSREIKKKIIKHKKVKAKYAYPLSRGGIGVHIENQADKEKLLQRWPEGSFQKNTDSLIVHENKPKPLHTLRNKRNIPTRCFQCQEFGHIAAICKKVNFCENCAEPHEGKCKNKQNHFCGNVVQSKMEWTEWMIADKLTVKNESEYRVNAFVSRSITRAINEKIVTYKCEKSHRWPGIPSTNSK
ncbi:hypothetical protein MAR_017931 [Mya arenaria]|uniref:CCHC-type domain-containing protein n=1 Tax=Mya arenaria TaxID=6604 RepID=A0ABY7EH30_MYAAR|nr:hypothetical protein MAR_017931 [Mya arenaria]